MRSINFYTVEKQMMKISRKKIKDYIYDKEIIILLALELIIIINSLMV